MKSITNYQLPITIIAVLTAICFTACQPNTQDEPERPIQSSYPRKHLIEEFTGQECGYCPYGMDCIHEFMENDTNFILVLHHYGYKKDHFSVSGSQTITNTLGVSGAPSMSIDRAKTKYGSKKDVVFHPGYLENVSKDQFETETYTSIHIDNTYDADSRNLTVKVSGEISDPLAEGLYLTVLVKESGMIDYQQDYNNTYEGWKEFRHTNAVRAFLTNAKGDELIITKQRYNETYTLTLDNKWVPENCMVVAFITENFQPVIQAEQAPVVSDTQGGADIRHEGVTPVPVADYYPEPGEHTAPSDFSEMRSEPMTAAQAQYRTYAEYGFNYWQIVAINSNDAVSVNNTSSIRYATIYLFTETTETTIPAGTYTFNRSEQPGSAYAGIRVDEQLYVGGSMFYFLNRSYYNQGSYIPTAQWLIADGTLTITDTGWEVNCHARNGAEIHLEGSTPIVNKGKASAPLKLPQQDPQHIEYCTPQ